MKLDALTQNIVSEKLSASDSPDSQPLKANVIERKDKRRELLWTMIMLSDQWIMLDCNCCLWLSHTPPAFSLCKLMVGKNYPVILPKEGRRTVRFLRCEPCLKAPHCLTPIAVTQAKGNISPSCVYWAEF